MDELIDKLNVAIEICKDDFAAMETKYNNVFPHGIPGHDLALDLAMEDLKCAHRHFESVCNDRPLLLETKTTLDELIVKWPELNAAIERCKDDFAAVEAEYNKVLQYGIVEHNLALNIAMEDIKQAHLYFELVCNDARHFIDMMIARKQKMTARKQNTAAIPEEMKTVEDNLRLLALDPNKKD